jgi:YfiH family protein
MIESAHLTAAAGIRHGFFTRRGGVSQGLYAALNCGLGSADDPDAIRRNRALCAERLALPPAALATAYQVHGNAAVQVDAAWVAGAGPRADAMVTAIPGVALGVLTADCAPILLADPGARVIGAAHAGWKGAKAGVAESVVRAMERLGAARDRILATVGPAIGPESYEVGTEFRAAFLHDDDDAERFFADGPRGRPHFDLQGFVAARLTALGLAAVERIPGDTCSEPERFFSYRRACLAGEADYGRQLSAIALV